MRRDQRLSKKSNISNFFKIFKENFFKNKKTGFVIISSPWALENKDSISNDLVEKLMTYEGFYMSVNITDIPEITPFFSQRKVKINQLPAIIEYSHGRCVGLHTGVSQISSYLKYGEIINGKHATDTRRNAQGAPRSRSKNQRT